MKEIAASITKNASAMLGAQAVTWVSGFVLMIFLPRYLGSEAFGRLYVALSFSMIAQVLVDYGAYLFIAKEIARSPENAPSVIGNSVGLRIVLAVVACAAMIIGGFIAGYQTEIITMILIFGLAKFWEGILAVIRSSFQGFERMEFNSIANVIERIVLLLFVVLVLMLGGNTVFIAIAMASSTLIGTLVAARYLTRFVTRIPPFDWPHILALARRGIPYFLVAVFATIYYRINAIMLSLLVTEEIVGWFGAAFRFFDVLMFLPSIFSFAVFPVLSRMSNEKDTARATTRKSFELLFMAVVPISMAVFIYSDQIVDLLFGRAEYGGSAAVLQALSVGLILVYLNFVLVTTLIAMDKHRQWSLVALGAIPLSIGLNWLLIPLFETMSANGGVGSAIATNLTELFVMLCAFILLPKGYIGIESLKRLGKCTVAGCTMMGASVALAPYLPYWWLGASLAVGSYCVMLYVVRFFDTAELRFATSMMTVSGLRAMFSSEGRNAR